MSNSKPTFQQFPDPGGVPRGVNSWQKRSSWKESTTEHGPRRSLPSDEIEEGEEERHCCPTFCCCVLNIMPANVQDVLVNKVPTVAYIIFGAILGLLIGLCFGGKIDSTALIYLKLLGSLWLNGLKCVVLPFIFTNMATSVADVRSLKGSKSAAKLTFLWYFLTTLLAVTVGVFCSYAILIPNQTTINLNNRTELAEYVSEKKDLIKNNKFNVAEQPAMLAKSLIPENLVDAMAKNRLVGVIMCGIIVGMLIETKELDEANRTGADSGPANGPAKMYVLIMFLREINKLCFKIIHVLVAFTPVGVVSLVAAAVAVSDLGAVIKDVSLFLGAVMTGLFIHALIIYPTLFFIFTRSNPFPVMKNVLPAFVTALSTSSSAATYPVTYRNAVDDNKVRPSTAKFVLSLGMTANMDGTAIGFPCAVIFIASAIGKVLSFGQVITMALTAALASMGAGPIPSAGMVLLVSILDSVGLDATHPVFGFIIAIDWMYDRPETAVNIFGDSLGAVVVDRHVAKNDEDDLTIREQEMGKV